MPPDSGANLKSISHRCHPILVAFAWELTEETIDLPLGCLQGGAGWLSSGGREGVARKNPQIPEFDLLTQFFATATGGWQCRLAVCERADGERDWYFIAEQPAPAPHLAQPEGCAALRIVLVTVPRASRSCEHFPDGFDLHLLQADGDKDVLIGSSQREKPAHALPWGLPLQDEFKAHGLLYHSTLGLRVIKKKKDPYPAMAGSTTARPESRVNPNFISKLL